MITHVVADLELFYDKAPHHVDHWWLLFYFSLGCMCKYWNWFRFTCWAVSYLLWVTAMVIINGRLLILFFQCEMPVTYLEPDVDRWSKNHFLVFHTKSCFENNFIPSKICWKIFFFGLMYQFGTTTSKRNFNYWTSFSTSESVRSSFSMMSAE